MDTSEENLTEVERSKVTEALLTMRIIAGTLIMGVTTFAAIVIFLIHDDGANGNTPLLFWLAIVVAAIAIMMSQFMMAMMSRAAVTSDFSMEKGITLYSSRLIVGLAILEGAAFFTLVALMLTGKWLLLAGTAILVVIMFTRFPSRRGLIRWIEERKQLAELAGNE